MTSNSVNGSKIVFDIMDNYNIKSDDFVSRCPNWISACLDDLGISQTYTPFVHRTAFNNSRCVLPPFCKTVDWVVINGWKANYNESLYTVDGDDHIDSFITAEENITPIAQCSNVPTFYRISNGWVHTNVTEGTIEIKCKVKEFELDEILKIEFPMIPNEIHTITAIMWYVLKTMLMRGYIHPILNLKENNPITNPGIAYSVEKIQSRIHCGRTNIDSREKQSSVMSTLFGRRKNVYIKVIDKEVVVPTYGYDDDGDPYCEFISGQNTGNQLQVQKQYSLVGDVKTYTGVTKIVSSYNVIACPILLYLEGYLLSPTSTIDPIIIPLITYMPQRSIVALPVSGWNYIYIVAPINKRLSVDVSGIDITATLLIVGQYSATGYFDSNVYRSKSKFSTELGFEFNIKLS